MEPISRAFSPPAIALEICLGAEKSHVLPAVQYCEAKLTNVLFIELHGYLSVFSKIRLLTGHPSF